MVRLTCGNLVMTLASSLSCLLVDETTLQIMRAVSMPSPVASPGRMMWPDCSPPMGMFFLRMAAATLESPTEVISIFR